MSISPPEGSSSRVDGCWAASLGDCRGGISGEHIISKSQFDTKSINSRGLPWCRGETKTVGLASLVANNLCSGHNSDLSPTDAEALRFRKALEAVRADPSTRFDQLIDARRLERWVLKTSINLALQSPDSGLPLTPELVQQAFGRNTPSRGQGLFIVTETGETLGRPGHIYFETLRHGNDGPITLTVFRFHGLRLVYAFAGAPAVNGALRLERIRFPPHRIRLRWLPPFDAEDNVMKVDAGLPKQT